MTETEFMEDTIINYDDESATLGDRIEAARNYKDMTRKELADRLGVKKSTIKKWENDQAEPRSNRLYMMAGVLDCNVMWLLNGEGDTPLRGDGLGTDKTAGMKAELKDIKREIDRLSARIESMQAQL